MWRSSCEAHSDTHLKGIPPSVGQTNFCQETEMISHLWSFARSGVIALAAVASLSPAASGAPLGPVVDQSVADNSPNKPILVWQGEGRDFGPGYRVWPRGRWGGGGGNWGGRWGGGGH